MRLPSVLRLHPLALLALAACGSAPPAPSSPGAGVGAPSAAAPAGSAAPDRPSLLDEQRRLAALFKGTPVVFTMLSSTSLRVDVPLRFCFDPHQATLKPPLAAVIDRLAQSQHDANSRIVVAAASDAAPRPPAAASAPKRPPNAASLALSQRRATSVRDRFAAQGVPGDRLGFGDEDAAGVTIVVREAPAP